ncbi:DUF4913 domain-containing protein [Nocardia sp. NPDC059239]|uniref:DUF4913 domain-containing protein n=1 Tax=unclassified Nocardia TaxID=2637762 RepID=UPI0036CFD8A5
MPVGWFGQPRTPPKGGPDSDGHQPPPPRFAHYADFVHQWLLPVTAVRTAANHCEGHYTWCRQWWAHHGLGVRFAAVHAAFEAARRSDDDTAMSTLFVAHIDPPPTGDPRRRRGPLHRWTPPSVTSPSPDCRPYPFRRDGSAAQVLI